MLRADTMDTPRLEKSMSSASEPNRYSPSEPTAFGADDSNSLSLLCTIPIRNEVVHIERREQLYVARVHAIRT